MPSFCRHGRFEANCPICAKKTRSEARPAPSRARPARASRATPARAPSRSRGRSGVVVRRVERAADDGYAHDLVPGLRARADAVHLADEIAFATARLAELAAEPPGLYAEAALAGDREEALWLVAQIAMLSPLETDDPWTTIAAVRTTWASGEDPEPGDLPLGPRAGVDARRGAAATFAAYRAWAARAGGQGAAFDGEAAWTSPRRFDRAFERLSLPGLGRSARYELLVLVGRLGLVDLEPWTLVASADASDPTVVAAKRAFGIGDAMNIGRRATELCQAADVPVAALDLALRNWDAPPQEPRIRAAATVEVDPTVRDRLRATLGVAAEEEDAEGDQS